LEMSEALPQYYFKHRVRYYPAKHVYVDDDDVEVCVPQEVFDILTKALNHVLGLRDTRTMTLLYALREQMDYTRDISPLFKYLHFLILVACNEGQQCLSVVDAFIKSARKYAVTKDLVEYLDLLSSIKPLEYQITFMVKKLLRRRPLSWARINFYDELTDSLIAALYTDSNGSLTVRLIPKLWYKLTFYVKGKLITKKIMPTPDARTVEIVV